MGKKAMFAVHIPRTACGRDRTDAVPRPSSRYTSSTEASKQATRERSLNLDRTSGDLLKPYVQYQQQQ